MKAQLSEGELILHGSVGMDFMEAGLMATDVRAALVGLDGDITVRLNSGGGDAFEGAAIHSVLSAHGGKVTVIVEGIAASAASLVAMAADEIVMTEGAVMMIHDPSALTLGTADDHVDSADMLNTLANEYAGIYARRAGMNAAAMRDLMKMELWMGAEESVERGFADRVEIQEERKAAAAFPYHKFASPPERLVALARAQGWDADGLRLERAALPAGTKEAEMPKEATPAVQPETNTPEVAMAVKPEVNLAAEAALAAQERRKVVMAIPNAVKMLSATEIEDIVTAAEDAPAAKMKAVDLICEKRMADEPSPTARATITEDGDERKLKAMQDALHVTMFGGKLEGPGEEYRGLTPKRLAIELSGGYRHGVSDIDMIKKGMAARGVLMAGGFHTTSDFTFLTASTLNRALREAYDSRPGTWRQISRQRTATDFRTLYSVQAGGDFSLQSINETGEYTGTVLTDTGESFAVVRHGRKVLLSFEAIVNDDLSAFNRIPQDFARAALNLESKIAWDLINANAAMSDGDAFFHANHTNLGTAGAISVTTVGEARELMYQQRPLGADATGSDFIEASPNLLYVPPALEITAMQFTTATVPATDGTTNPFKSTLSPVVDPRLGVAVTGGSDTAWYLFDSTLPPMEHAFLSGFEQPTIDPVDQMDPDGTTIIARHIFGAGLVEFRGAFKNAGV